MDVMRRLLGAPPDTPIREAVLLFKRKGKYGIRIRMRQDVNNGEPEFMLMPGQEQPNKTINHYLELALNLEWIPGSAYGRDVYTLHTANEL